LRRFVELPQITAKGVELAAEDRGFVLQGVEALSSRSECFEKLVAGPHRLCLPLKVNPTHVWEGTGPRSSRRRNFERHLTVRDFTSRFPSA